MRTAHPHRLLPLAALTVGVTLVGGCSFFSRTKSTIYSLDTIPGAMRAVRGTPVGIGDVELPSGFDRKEIVVRKTDAQLDVRGTEQWPATLSDVVVHTLAFDLAGRLPDGMVILPGETKPSAMRSIDVAFEQIAAGPDSRVIVDAVWGRTHHEHIEVPISNLQSASVASGMSQAIGLLADRIAASI